VNGSIAVLASANEAASAVVKPTLAVVYIKALAVAVLANHVTAAPA